MKIGGNRRPVCPKAKRTDAVNGGKAVHLDHRQGSSVLLSQVKKPLIALSGEVNSALAAKLMKDRGLDCIGCTMKLYHNEDAGIGRSRACCSLDDVEDARSVAYKPGMSFLYSILQMHFVKKLFANL